MAFLEVMRQAVLLHSRSKVFRLLLVLAAVFAGLFLFFPFADRARGSEVFQMVSYLAGFTSFVPFVTLYLATQAVAGDIEDRTSVYLFTRPISRISLLVGKWLAVIVLGVVFVFVSASGLYVVLAYGPQDWRDGVDPAFGNYLALLGAGAVAVVGYSSVGCLCSALFRRPLIVAVLYIMIEQVVSRLPPQVGIHAITVAFPVRMFMLQNVEASEPLEEVLISTMDGDPTEEALLFSGDPLVLVGKVAIVTMAFGLWIYSRREYDSRPRE